MKVFFNNSCKICRSEINLYKKENIKDIDWIDITNNSDAEKETSRNDKELLRRLYNKNGYIDFRITSATGELSLDNSSFYVIFSIYEGKKFSIGNINYKSDIKSLDINSLKQVVSIKKGEIYNSLSLEKSVNKISFPAIAPPTGTNPIS